MAKTFKTAITSNKFRCVQRKWNLTSGSQLKDLSCQLKLAGQAETGVWRFSKSDIVLALVFINLLSVFPSATKATETKNRNIQNLRGSL